MELLQLKYFCVLARCESVTQAAEELMVSQPSLSKTLKTLEQNLGTQLFDRKGKYIRLNHIGELFYRNVSQSLSLIDDTIQTITDLSESPSGQVNVLINAASTFMPELYVRFCRKYPSIRLVLDNFVQAEHRIHDFDLFISDFNHYPSLAYNENHTLLTERMMLGVWADHPFADRACVDLAEAADMPFISSNRNHEINNLCMQAGFKPNIVVQCDNGNTYSWLLINHIGITILPEIAMGAILPEDIICVPFTNPSAERAIKLYWNPQRYMSKAALLFRDFCIEYFEKLRQMSRAELRQTVGEVVWISGV